MNWNNTVGGKKAELIPCPDGIEGCLVAHYKVIEKPSNELAEDLEGAKLVILRLNKMLRQQQAEIEALKSRELTLTNEEILEYADAYGVGIGNIYEFGHGQFIAVIRAILRKAQNK